jgi:membrane protein YdbS with pleckstrin-like domain
MWVAVFMVAYVVPFVIWGSVLAWREWKYNKEQEKEQLAISN